MRIIYTINNGSLPITVELIGTEFSNIHTEYGTFSFDNLPEQEYNILFTDNDNCIYETEIVLCTDCPSGYTAIGNDCILYDEKDIVTVEPLLTIIAESKNSSYGSYGTLLFNDWNYDGTGTYERILTPYWKNNWTTLGPLNRTAVWANVHYAPQDIGFSFCVNIAVKKTYYVGFACDNWGKVKLNGNFILEQDVNSLTNMIISNGDSYDGHSDRIPFRYWYIYPITFEVGQNILEVFGHNETLLAAAIGIQIYDATPNEIKNATSDADLGAKILFDSIDLVGTELQYEYSLIGGLHGYYCEDGYALDTCGDTIKCIKRDVVSCLTEPTTTTTTTTTTSTTTTTTTTTICYDGYSYNVSYYNCGDCGFAGIGQICNEYQLTIGKWYFDSVSNLIMHITSFAECSCDYTQYHILDITKRNACNNVECFTSTTTTSTTTSTTTTLTTSTTTTSTTSTSTTTLSVPVIECDATVDMAVVGPEGTAMLAEFFVDIGNANLGETGFYFYAGAKGNPEATPDRFQIFYDDELVADTLYTGSKEYDIIGTYLYTTYHPTIDEFGTVIIGDPVGTESVDITAADLKPTGTTLGNITYLTEYGNGIITFNRTNLNSKYIKIRVFGHPEFISYFWIDNFICPDGVTEETHYIVEEDNITNFISEEDNTDNLLIEE